jgi:hypothetical protein
MDFDKIKTRLSSLNSLIANKKISERLNKDNQLNSRMSVVLHSLYDIETIAIRLNRNIILVKDINRKIQSRNRDEDKQEIGSIGQQLRKDAECINRENFLDLKTLHIFVKIFLDDFTELMRFIFNWRDIGDRSITKFYNSLKKYSGDDVDIIAFKEKCFFVIEKIIDLIVDHRDHGIVHNQQKHKQSIWSINDMRGNVMQVAVLSPGVERSSLNQHDLLELLFEYLDLSVGFMEDSFKMKQGS